mmetsp:Transcript_14591/g.39037  ORF Transcript_14591/g.39037 Transcript_14591/m.39037 type:complete len:331 (+) Transcript_14591:80-1072(+)
MERAEEEAREMACVARGDAGRASDGEHGESEADGIKGVDGSEGDSDGDRGEIEMVSVADVYEAVIEQTLALAHAEFRRLNMGLPSTAALEELRRRWSSSCADALRHEVPFQPRPKRRAARRRSGKRRAAVNRRSQVSPASADAPEPGEKNSNGPLVLVKDAFSRSYYNSPIVEHEACEHSALRPGAPAPRAPEALMRALRREHALLIPASAARAFGLAEVSIPQLDGSGGGVADDSSSPLSKRARVEDGGGADLDDDEEEPPLNSDDDDLDLDGAEDAVGEEPETDNLILAQYEKVTKKQGKWKVQLKDGIVIINRRDYLFSKAICELQW